MISLPTVLRSGFHVKICLGAVRNGFCMLRHASPAIDQLKSQLEGDDRYRHTVQSGTSNEFGERLASEILDGSLQQRRLLLATAHSHLRKRATRRTLALSLAFYRF